MAPQETEDSARNSLSPTEPDAHARRRLPNWALAIIAGGLWIAAIGLAAFLVITGEEAGAGRVTNQVSTTRSSVPGPTLQGVGPATQASQATAAASTTTFAAITSTTAIPATTTTQATTTTTLPPMLTLAAGGDVLGDRGVGLFIDEHGGPSVLAKVKPFLESAHLAFVNLECPISDKGTRTVGKEYTFRGRTALAEGLVSAGIDVVSLANNHVLDYGQTALRDTLRRLDEAGVAHAGAGTDSSQAAAPTLLITPAGTVALLAFTEIIPGGFAATSTRGGVNPAVPDYKKMLSAIKAAAAKTDFVVVSVHWGTEYTPRPSSGQQALAHRAIDAGADLIIGHHPHVIQGIELYKDKLIAYSLGDFVFDHYSRQTGEAFVFRVSLPRQGLPALEIVPVYLHDKTGVPSLVSGAEADTILGRLIKLSADLGLKLVQEGDRAKLADDPAITP